MIVRFAAVYLSSVLNSILSKLLPVNFGRLLFWPGVSKAPFVSANCLVSTGFSNDMLHRSLYKKPLIKAAPLSPLYKWGGIIHPP